MARDGIIGRRPRARLVLVVLVAALAASAAGPALAQVVAPEDTLAACRDSADNDRDGRVDCWDEDCRPLSVCARPGASYERSEDTIAACQDRVDNDGDSLVDCIDPGCRPWRICAGGPPPVSPPAAPAVEPELTLAACQDGRDNDGDGLTDCGDQDCLEWLPCAGALPPPSPAPPPPPTPPPAPAPMTGRLRVTCGVAGASVTVDGQARGTAPVEGEVPAGAHQVRVEAEGYLPDERTVTVAAGPEVTSVGVGLRPLPVAPPPAAPAEPAPPEPEERDPIGWLALGLGVQVPFLTMGEASSTTTGGASFVLRPAVALVRRPIAFELGVQLAAGYLADSSYPRIERAGVEHETSDALAFYDAKYFQVGLYLGLTIPVLTAGRPVLALVVGITNGITAYPLQYVLDAAVGLSWFATRLVELRLELLGVELRRVDALMTRVGEEDDSLEDVWIVHLAPAILLNFRF